MPARIRTAPGAYEIIKEADPETAVTLHYIRKLIRTGEFPSVAVGRKKLINVDRLMEYLGEMEPEREGVSL